MTSDTPAGVVFPVSADGRRSTSALGRALVAEALSRVDPDGARIAARETQWRSGYMASFRRLIEAGLPSRQAAVSIAHDGLQSLHRRMHVIGQGGAETGLDALATAPAQAGLSTVTVTGTGEAAGELSVPYRGERLRGGDLGDRLDAWVAGGVIEPSCAEAVRTVAAYPEWLALPGRTVVVLGAGAEMGPLPALLRWGATVVAVDLPRPLSGSGCWTPPGAAAGPCWSRSAARRPAPGAAGTARISPSGPALTWPSDVPAVADWLDGRGGSAGRWATTSTPTVPPTSRVRWPSTR